MKPRRGDDCVGYVAGLDGANLDVSGRSDAPLVLRDSNSGTLSMPMGGVCHNICKNHTATHNVSTIHTPSHPSHIIRTDVTLKQQTSIH